MKGLFLASVHRSADQDPEESRRERYKVEEREFPLVEVVHTENR